MTPPASRRAPSRRALRLGVAGAALLALAGAALFAYAVKRGGPKPEDGAIAVAVRDGRCEPNDLTVPAGRAVFHIRNQSDRTLEWEILDGVMVVEERENIPPGFSARLTARLKPGTYQITCGLLSNPRGTLTVTPSAASEAARARPPITAFIGPLSEYKVTLALQSSAFVTQVGRLREAIAAGDLDAAKARFAEARAAYRRLEPMAARFGHLKNALDGAADYLAEREADAAFRGLPRIEYGLFAKGAVEGLAPVAAALAEDAAALKARLRELKLAPEDLFGASARQARLLADGAVVHGLAPYAKNDAAELGAELDGMAKAAGLLSPLLKEASPEAATALDLRFAETRAALAGLSPGAGRDDPARTALAQRFGALSDALRQAAAALGLE
ncbi:iron transporter substrate-binding protein [Methylopila jiangsuensis]|uniref:Iron transporter substrate-binding protein n=1 Tax=Methylopila jiangsuensis TaxID=586230 RepID=A0A9W6JHM9_9HYPH|nr:iron uptake system protein EfeO [Methylopila jiangsuensis]MDR6284254.1 iron uptake system component EfeO [Methylopila jiangsuensis]GLK76229.1 iron transporter substrate-binding protein [Methylopila jiangsuensis]